MGGFSSKDGVVPSEGNYAAWYRIKNAAKNNFRGILGFLTVFIAAFVIIDKEDKAKKLGYTWFSMAVFLLFHTIKVPLNGIIPIFMFPLLGICSSDVVCKAYVNEYILLLVIGGWNLMLFNYVGITRWLMFKIIGLRLWKDSAITLMLKSSVASFFLSAISDRLLATEELTTVLCQVLTNVQDTTPKAKEGEIRNKYRDLLCCLIHTSATFGSFCLIHANYTTMVALAIYGIHERNAQYKRKESFNYLNYVAFAVPLALALFVVNFVFFVLLYLVVGSDRWRAVFSKNDGETVQKFDENQMREIYEGLEDVQKNMQFQPVIRTHVVLAVFFWLVLHALLVFRWSDHFKGWASFSVDKDGYPEFADLSVMVGIVILLHSIPNSYDFLKYATARRKCDLPPPKPCSTILFFKFVDQHTPYFHWFLGGAGMAIVNAVHDAEIQITVRGWFHGLIDPLNWSATIAAIVFLGALLSNMVSSCGAAVLFVPAVVFLDTGNPHWAALGAGLACSLGLMSPFSKTPTYYSYKVGGVRPKFMFLYNLLPVVLSSFILWLFLAFYGTSLVGPVRETDFAKEVHDLT